MAQTVKTKGPTFSPEWRFQEPIAWRDTDLNEKTLKGCKYGSGQVRRDFQRDVRHRP